MSPKHVLSSCMFQHQGFATIKIKYKEKYAFQIKMANRSLLNEDKQLNTKDIVIINR